MTGRPRRPGRLTQDATASGSAQINQAGGDLHIHHHHDRSGEGGGPQAVPGWPLEEVTDPFTLEVHRPITLAEAGGLPPLPPYVRRPHDERLAQVVARAADGHSAMAVLVAGSSAGKTRALWEALEPLRRAGGWRVWHPYDPTRPEAAAAALDRVGPRMVVWLNETQEYLGAFGDAAERGAAKLRSLLTDPDRGPVLVLGTLWPEHYAALTQRPSSLVAQVLDGTVIELPEVFTGADLDAVERAAGADARLAAAVEQAEDGHITQYLAGAPELLARFATAPVAAKAVIWAAMDARRMGHRIALPLALLEAVAPAYLTDAQWDQLGEDWLEQALAYTARPCKGARGPVTRIRAARIRHRTGNKTAADGREDGPVCRLADYLEQHGRRHRADQMPPIDFWAAAAAHAHPADLAALGSAAWARGLYRDAAQLHKNATAHGNPWAAAALVAHLHTVHPADHRPAHWAAAHAVLDDPAAVFELMFRLHEAGAAEQVTALLARNPAAHAALGNPTAVGVLLDMLRWVGATEQVTELAERAAAHTPADNPYWVVDLLFRLQEAGAIDQLAALAERIAVHVPLDDPITVRWLLDRLRDVGATEAELLVRLRVVGATEQVTELQEATDAAIWAMEKARRERGAADQQPQTVRCEADQPIAEDQQAAAHVTIDDPAAVVELLVRLHEAGAAEQVTALLARNPAAHAALDDPDAATELLNVLRDVGAHEQVAALAERLPAAGQFVLFLDIADHRERFQFGREPDGSAAAPWTWDDLE